MTPPFARGALSVGVAVMNAVLLLMMGTMAVFGLVWVMQTAALLPDYLQFPAGVVGGAAAWAIAPKLWRLGERGARLFSVKSEESR